LCDEWGQHRHRVFSDVALLSELVGLLESALIIFQEKCSPLGLEVKKTKIQSLSDFLPSPGNVVVEGEVVKCITEFIYLESLIHECCSVHDLHQRLPITRNARGELDKNVWSTRLPLDLKLRLYNACILSIFLYGSEAWSLTATEEKKIDALDQWCLRRIKWSDFVTNEEVPRRIYQLSLASIMRKRRLGLCSCGKIGPGQCVEKTSLAGGHGTLGCLLSRRT